MADWEAGEPRPLADYQQRYSEWKAEIDGKDGVRLIGTKVDIRRPSDVAIMNRGGWNIAARGK